MKIDRLLGILTTLLQKERVTAPYLAEKFEVSTRTIRRDIDALGQAGIPVVTMQGSGGGIFIAEGYKLDKSVLTYDELSSIIVSLKGLGSVSEPAQIERTLEKLTVNRDDSVISLRDHIIIDLASDAKESLTEKIAPIKEAIRDNRIISFTYYYHKGEMKRRIEPYCLLFVWSAWYVFGYCLDRRDFRMFKLPRVWNLSVEDAHFAPREITPEASDWGAFLRDEQPLVALFDPSEKYQLIDSYGLGSFTEEPDGRLRLSVGFSKWDFALRWLLGFGGKVEVVQPVEMAQALHDAAVEMLKKNHRQAGGARTIEY